MAIRIVCISDTHTYLKSVNVPPGDILIHSGDATYRGYEHEVVAFGKQFSSYSHMHKIYVAGNHDTSFQDTPLMAKTWLESEAESDIIYLQDEAVELEVDGEKIKIYGSPWQPYFCNWAFNLRTPEELKSKWDMIPKDTDILVTHGPGFKLRDQNYDGTHCGCRELRKAIQRVRPKLHVFGHIHEGYGISRWGDTIIANAASCTGHYQPTNAPLVFEWENGKVRQTS